MWSALSKRSWACERGAFTGCDTAKPGLIETAHTGTLFLDEITTFKSESAEQDFGVFQERSVQRMGRRYAKKIDLHLICATNDDLVPKGFREDLYYRIDVMPILVPPPARARGRFALLVHGRI